METRRLMRSATDKMIGGVCGGLGRYLGLDVTIVRLAFLMLFFLAGHGLLVYLLLWILMPMEPVTIAATAPRPMVEQPNS